MPGKNHIMDANAESSAADLDVMSHSSSDVSQDSTTSTPGSRPEAGTDVDVREDAPLMNQLGESQRLLDKAQAENEKLLDALIDMQTATTQAMAPQGRSTEEIESEFRREFEEMGASPELIEAMDKRVAGMVDAVLQRQVMPKLARDNDLMTKQMLEAELSKDPRMQRYKDEIEKLVFKETAPQIRATYDPQTLANTAVQTVAYRHLNEIIEEERKAALNKGKRDVRIEGESPTIASQVRLDDGTTADLTEDELSVCRKHGLAPEKYAARKKARMASETSSVKGLRGF